MYINIKNKRTCSFIYMLDINTCHFYLRSFFWHLNLMVHFQKICIGLLRNAILEFGKFLSPRSAKLISYSKTRLLLYFDIVASEFFEHKLMANIMTYPNFIE